MSNNNVELTGYPTKQPKYIDKTDTPFIAFGFATQESYKDQNDQWQQQKPAFHDVLTFKSDLIEQNKELTTKDRLKIKGQLSYEFIKAKTLDGKDITLKRASIIAHSIEAAPFPQKQEANPSPSNQ